ncbi:MAG: hydroxyethylthiazole kinase [Hyphomicrobiales bacterium]
MSQIAEASDRELAALAGESLERLRERAPRVHCLTNTVAQTLTANLLLAAGAIPAMSMALDEIDAMVAGSGALLVNLGTLDEARRAAMTRAVEVAGQAHRPWVLDPVMVERAPARLAFARALLAQRPAVVRGNSEEIAALGGDIDAVVAETGPVDVVRDGARELRLTGGHPLMARVTGLGCAGSALVAAFCAVNDDPLQAAAQALLTLGRAAERAAKTAEGPASFQIALLDGLYRLDAATLEARP